VTQDLTALAYLVSAICFIMALRGLSSPETSRGGNRFGIAGMVIAIATTLAQPGVVSYPIIDVKAGGTIDGELVALNKVIAMAAPGPQAEGGTLIVPGHGRMCDQAEVALYLNMLTIIRNTVQYYKNQGKTLQQVLDLKPSAGYDQRWGATNGSWTTRDFITAVYETLPAKGPVFFSMKTTTSVPSGKVF